MKTNMIQNALVGLILTTGILYADDTIQNAAAHETDTTTTVAMQTTELAMAPVIRPADGYENVMTTPVMIPEKATIQPTAREPRINPARAGDALGMVLSAVALFAVMLVPLR